MYIGNNLRTERLRKTKIGTQVAHVTHDSDTIFKVKRSKVNLQGHGNIVADSRTSLIFINHSEGVRTKVDKGEGVDFYCIFADVLYG